MTTPLLTVGYYVPTDRFRRIAEHVSVMRVADQGLVALVGPSSDAESRAWARRIADEETVLQHPAFRGLFPTGYAEEVSWRADLATPTGGLTFCGSSPADALHNAATWLRDRAQLEGAAP